MDAITKVVKAAMIAFPLTRTSCPDMVRPNMLRVRGFTLMELMVVLVIIGILILLAMPSFDGLFMDAYSLEAKNQLKFLQTRQQIYYQRKFSYASDMQQIGFSQPKSILEGGEARYSYEIVESGTAKFVARATAIVDFDKDGVINIWEVNESGEIVEKVPD